MSKYLHSIYITEPINLAVRYLLEARFRDEENEYWDKTISYGCNDIKRGKEKLSNAITTILCADKLPDKITNFDEVY